MSLLQFDIANKINEGVNGFYQKNINKTMNKILSYVSTLRRFNTPQAVALGLPDPYMSYQWEAFFPSVAIDNGTGVGVKAVSYTPILENINMSFPSIQKKELEFNQRSINVPNAYRTCGEVTGTFYCDNRLQILNYFNTWRTQVRDDYGLFGFPSEYKKDVFIYALGMKSIVPVYVFKLIGVFPLSLNSMTLNSKGDRITSSITFSFDDFLFEPVRIGQVAAQYLDGNIAGIMASQAQASGSTALHDNFLKNKQDSILSSIGGMFSGN